LLLLLLTIALIWLCWKLYPILKNHGGLRSLFKLQPLDAPAAVTEPEKTEEKKETPKESQEEKDKSLADKDVDQT
jgi:type III secretion protein J